MLKKICVTYLSVLLALLMLDGLWLGWLAKDTYQQQIGFLMRQEMPVWPWVIFYVLYSASIVYLAIVSSEKLNQGLSKGFVLGLSAYGAYNLTNYTLTENWPLAITLQDWAWGCTVTSITALVGMWVWLRCK
ncbi:DUF2177 family protein [Flavobacterium sp. W21_SRS_FM6]|uniref:DUF2177 family protein n=1 Tax=Flavobacterium sp. W21_SRS_FM6 TaxID=3240268 RepID=UPI003F908E36